MERSDLDRFLAEFDATLKEPVPPLLRGFALAGDILCSVLGFQWAKRHVFDSGTASHFMRAGATTAADSFRRTDRVIALGEVVFNLGRLPGFKSRIPLLQAGDVESLLAELEIAKLLVRAGFP